MARPLRIEYEGAVYHVTSRGNERGKIYFAQSDYEQFMGYLAMARERFGCFLHGYVLMGNHYHLILETPQGNLGRVMHYINGSYSTYLNARRKRRGHLFQGRYKAILVDKDSYLLELSRYLHLNPVRAGMVKLPEDYAYSSYHAFVDAKAEPFLMTDTILAMMSRSRKVARSKYREFVEDDMENEDRSPFKEVYAGSILGSERFIKKVLKRLGGVFESSDVSHRKALEPAVDSDAILERICERYGCRRADLESGRFRRARMLAIHLLKTSTALSNQEIGSLLGGLSATGVSKCFHRNCGSEIFKRDIKGLVREMSRVEG